MLSMLGVAKKGDMFIQLGGIYHKGNEMAREIRLAAETIRTLGFATIAAAGATYTGIGTRFNHPVRIFFVQNLTNALLKFSFDGTNDHFVLPQGGYLLLDVTGNKANTQGFYIAEASRLYVQEVGTPTSGDVYLSLFYGADQEVS